MSTLIDCLDCYSKEVLKNYNPKNMIWNFEEGVLLLGSESLHKTLYKEQYSHFVLRFLDEKLDLSETLSSEITFPALSLFHSFEDAKKLKYIKAIESFASNLETFNLDFSYKNIPFFAKYDTVFGGKKNYNKISNFLEDKEKNLSSEKREEFMFILLETLDNMAEEAFLEYRQIQRLLKRVALTTLENPDPSLLKAYVFLKGARQFHLKYDYKKLGLNILRDNLDLFLQNGRSCSQSLGLILLCQNELLLMNR